MGKDKKSKGTTLDIHAFNKLGGVKRKTGISLPSAPGALPSGPGQGRGYGRGGRRQGGYNNDGPSRSDASNQWRRPGGRAAPPRSGGFDNDRRRDRGDRDRGDRGHDRERREPQESRYGDDFGRSNFGTKKASGVTRISTPNRSGFGRSMARSMGDSDRTMDRSGFGSKTGAAPLRSGYGGFNRDNNERRSQSASYSARRGDFDGSGSGFGAHLVADLLNQSSANETGDMGRRLNYNFDAPKKTSASRFARGGDDFSGNRDPSKPWGNTAPARSMTAKTAEERAEANTMTEAELEAKQVADQRKAEKQAARETKEEAKRKKEAEKQRLKEEKEHLASLRNDVHSMFEEGMPRDLTMEHLEIVMPQLDDENDMTRANAQILGTALAMTVNKDVISMINAIDYIPNRCFDHTLVSMLSALCTRMGDMNFVNEVQAQGVDVYELARSKDKVEQRLLDAGLKCLVSDNETESKLDESFQKHIGLNELYELLSGIEDLGLELLPKVVSYIFDEFFTNQNVEDPGSFFVNQPIFDLIATRMGGQTEIVDCGIKSWHANGEKADTLLPVFDHLLRTACIYPEGIIDWQQDVEAHDAKMAAMFCQIDDERTFNDWIMTVEDEYQYDDEEYYDDDDEDEYDAAQTYL